jgi:CHAD domain-containing protein
MHRALIPPGEVSAAPLQPEWRQRLEAWRTFLAQCGSKPSRKSVHALRALTLRLRVELEHSLTEQAEDPVAARAFQRWSKEAKKLRKSLEPVRDADVFLARLDSLHDSHRRGMEDETQLTPRCTREIEKLENRLSRERLERIEKLVDVLGERGKRLNRLGNEMEAAFALRMPVKAPVTTQATLKIIDELAGELPSLDATNLHEYRKRLKPALYLAEISAAADPLAGRLAIAFRKIHDAVGEWHDWQALAQEADRVFARHGRQDGLVPVLEALAEKALHKALGQCRRSAALYVKNAGKIRTSQRPASPRN